MMEDGAGMLVSWSQGLAAEAPNRRDNAGSAGNPTNYNPGNVSKPTNSPEMIFHQQLDIQRVPVEDALDDCGVVDNYSFSDRNVPSADNLSGVAIPTMEMESETGRPLRGNAPAGDLSPTAELEARVLLQPSLHNDDGGTAGKPRDKDADAGRVELSPLWRETDAVGKQHPYDDKNTDMTGVLETPSNDKNHASNVEDIDVDILSLENLTAPEPPLHDHYGFRRSASVIRSHDAAMATKAAILLDRKQRWESFITEVGGVENLAFYRKFQEHSFGNVSTKAVEQNYADASPVSTSNPPTPPTDNNSQDPQCPEPCGTKKEFDKDKQKWTLPWKRRLGGGDNTLASPPRVDL